MGQLRGEGRREEPHKLPSLLCSEGVWTPVLELYSGCGLPEHGGHLKLGWFLLRLSIMTLIVAPKFILQACLPSSCLSSCSSPADSKRTICMTNSLRGDYVLNLVSNWHVLVYRKCSVRTNGHIAECRSVGAH